MEPGISQTPPAKDDGSATGSPPPPFTPDPKTTAAPAAPPSPPPAAPADGAPKAPVVGDGGIAPPTPQQPFTPADPVVSAASSGRRVPKKLLIPVVAVIVLLIGAAAFYFGYYNSPSVIYSQSLSNTGKGYDQLIDYADKHTGLYDKGMTGSGTYKFSSKSFSTDGKIGYKGDGVNSDLTFDMGISGSRVSADIRTIKSTGTTPDIYVKASGIKSLGASLGSPEFNTLLAKLDGNWIVIDHTLLDSYASASQSDSSGGTSLTSAQVLDEAKAFGEVNKQYLFSTSPDKAVTKVVKNIGKETVDGHSTYHYKIALNKGNVKKYIQAQKDALKGSKLNDWLKKNNYEKSVNDTFDRYMKSADRIKSGDTYDIWMDTGQRVIYKVRYAYKDNPASNYVDYGLNYKGGSDYPFFIQGKSKTGGQTATYSITADVDTSTNVTGLKISYSADGSDGGDFSSDFSFKPSDGQVKIEKPAKALTLDQVLGYLGFGGTSSAALLNAGGTGGSPSTSPAVQLNDQLQGANPSGASAPPLNPAWATLLKQL